MFKFYNDPTVNESRIIVLLGQIRVYAEKRKSFEKGRRENGFESVEMYRQCKN